MTEIDKMYKNAGIKKIELDYPDNIDPFYPDFTAEKQLELIKWLMINMKDYQYDVEDNKFWFYIDDCRETKYREFDEALAELINLYWQDLTDQEKEEVRNILEDNKDANTEHI